MVNKLASKESLNVTAGDSQDWQLLTERASSLEGQYGRYIASPALLSAATTAMQLGMPLLVVGEPGSGKSDFAWAAARALGWSAPLRCHIRSDTTARDLLYYYDALARFGDAQHGSKELASDASNYIALRPLGEAIVCRDARRPVVLLDEIDKASRDLPNDLLHELDEARFEISEIALGDDRDGRRNGSAQVSTSRPDGDDAESAKVSNDGSAGEPPAGVSVEHAAAIPSRKIQRFMSGGEGGRKPLVVITCNDDAGLPEPFLRRCVFFYIEPHSLSELREIVRQRFSGSTTIQARVDVLTAVYNAIREDAGLQKRPSTAEMLNWILVISRLPEAAIRSFEDGLDCLDVEQGRLMPGGSMNWRAIPELGCLVKTRSDYEHIMGR